MTDKAASSVGSNEGSDCTDCESESESEVRVFSPKAILLDLAATVLSDSWEEECILAYVKLNLFDYFEQSYSGSISR